MADAAPSPYVTPNRAIPKIVGILNIVFAAGLLLVGLCWAGSTLATPYYMKAMNDLQKKAEADLEAKRQADLKQLEEEEKAAKTEEEKDQLRDMRARAKAQPATLGVPMFDFSKLMSSRELTAWTWVEIWTGIIVNGLLLASGIGLVLFRPWGRTLGLWTAGLKILRLVLVYGYCTFAIVPVFSRSLGQAVGEMMIKQQQVSGKPLPPGFGPEMFTRIYTVTYTILSVGMILVGSIYPLVVLWLLSRPSAKAACQGVKSPTKSGDAW
jgi:hypothetical protein